MKILTKKKQDKLLSLLCENAVIFHRNVQEDSDIESFIDITTEICECIDGLDGALKYLHFMERLVEKDRKKNYEILKGGNGNA